MQNFAATASYFESRAAKCSSGLRRRELEKAASLYRGKAAAMGHARAASAIKSTRDPLPSAIPSRRQKLIDLFRNYEAGRDAG